MKSADTKTTLLLGPRLVLPESVVERGALVIEDDLIAHVGDEDQVTRAEHTLDLEDLTLFPGFIDIHIHGAIGVDTMDATASDLERVSQFLATRGVTGWLPTLVPAPVEQYARAVESIERLMGAQQRLTGPSQGARALGVHYEGPFVNSAQCGALRSQFFRSFSSPTDLDDLPVIEGQVAKHLITVAPEIDGGVGLVRELHRRGWIIAIGHTRASFDLLDAALAAGAHHLTHFMNAMTPLHHRAPGPVAWGLLHDDVTCDLIADGVHLDPQMLRLLLKLKRADRLTLISDAVAAAGMGDGAYDIWGEKITVEAGRTRNSRGAIAGSVITMSEAVRMMLSVGASEIEAATMASTNPARLLGIDQDCGSIEEGKRADLVALDAGGNVRMTIIGGRVAFQA
ncbi:MAG: N-acetylglucosamine-6-phosphate deacetylase [bacterium]